MRCYLVGGRPRGGRRTYLGARDPSDPRTSRPVELPGAIRFAGESLAWGGGIAFYDPRGQGRVCARAYLLTPAQVSDVVAQEIRREPGSDLEVVAPRARTGCPIGGSAYDVALRLDDLDARPAVTITSSRPQQPASPSPAYLGWICAGLREAFAWTPSQIGEYLSQCPGVRGSWRAEDVVALAAGVVPQAWSPGAAGPGSRP